MAPCGSIGASAQLAPWNSPVFDRRLTGLSSGSSILVMAGIKAPRASASTPLAVIGAGKATPLGQVNAAASVSARSTVPAPSFMPGASVTSAVGTVPARQATEPSPWYTSAPSTTPAGST
ncbi:hypothetical protein WJ968_04480 [Achromobacter xylosoxidans]